MPKIKWKKFKWVVRVPVTVTLCVEVKARNEKTAIEEANKICNEIEGLYRGYKCDMERPCMIAPCYNGEEEDKAWWEDIEQCELFLTDKAVAEKMRRKS
jgi:hypothetical protein